jgi:hypothetical protein
MPRRGRVPGEIVYSGKELLNITVAASTTVSTTLQSLLVSSTSQVLGTLGTTFSMYRFEKLAFRIEPIPTGAGSGVVAIGYSNELSDTAPSNVSQIASMPVSVIMNAFKTVPTNLSVKKSYLVGENANKFWRTQISTAGTPSSTLWDDIQGTLYIRSVLAGTQLFDILLTYTVVLCDAQPPAITPAPAFRPTCRNLSGKCVLTLHGMSCPFCKVEVPSNGLLATPKIQNVCDIEESHLPLVNPYKRVSDAPLHQ